MHCKHYKVLRGSVPLKIMYPYEFWNCRINMIIRHVKVSKYAAKSFTAEAVEVPDSQRCVYPAYMLLSRERLRRLPIFPKTDVFIEGGWAETFWGEMFPLPNSTQHGQIFATNNNLKFLEKCNTIYIDRIFKLCPKLYSQVYTLNEWVISLVLDFCQASLAKVTPSS